MKKARNEPSFVDALEKEHHYAVLTKPGRIQILVQPSSKQLRKRGKRGWQLHATLGASSDADHDLLQTVQQALQAQTVRNGDGKSRKKKDRPAAE